MTNPERNGPAVRASGAPQVPALSGAMTGVIASRELSAPTQAKAPSTAESPVLLLHRSLRGRYPVVVVMSLVLGIVGGGVGWRAFKPAYRSEALVQIRYAQPALDPKNSEGGATPFDVFMESQQTLITSTRVVDRALRDPAWQALSIPITPAVLQRFINSLSVETRSRTEYLKIIFTDGDPLVARAAVQAVSNAYFEVYNADEQHLKNARLTVWKQRQKEVQGRLSSERTAIDAAVKKFGSTELAGLHETKLYQVQRIETELEDIHLALASLPPASSAADGNNPAPDRAKLDPEQIADTDAVMRGLLSEQRRLEQQLALMKLRYGDSFREIKVLQKSLDLAKDSVANYAARYHSAPRTPAPASADPDARAAGFALSSPAELHEKEKRLIALLERERDEMIKLETARIEIDLLKSSLQKDTLELDRINREIEAMQDQDQMGGRLTIINSGEVPLAPFKDYRMKVGAAAALAGASLPVGLFAGLGLLRRRYRYSDETAADISPSVPLLGILPTLAHAGETGRLDVHRAADAAQRIHQIRVLLESARGPHESATYLVTSASAGEGKTSIAMSLGLSFSAAGSRTLLVDGDLIAQQLTRGLRAEELPGLREALDAGTVQGYLRQTAGGLYVLPVGCVDPGEACALSHAAIRRLLAQARRHFDVILVDSGPILGSVEASVFAQELDGVLLVVSRGLAPTSAQQTMRHIAALGARVRGFVFNRAKSSDFQSSSYSSSITSERASSSSVVRNRNGRTRCRLGPLVEAVITSLPTHQVSLS